MSFARVRYGCDDMQHMFATNVTCDILLDAVKKQCLADMEQFSRARHRQLADLLGHEPDEQARKGSRAYRGWGILGQLVVLEQRLQGLESIGADKPAPGAEGGEGQAADAGDDGNAEVADTDMCSDGDRIEYQSIAKDKARLELHRDTRNEQLAALEAGVRKLEGLDDAAVDLGDDGGKLLGLTDKPRERGRDSGVNSKATYTVYRTDGEDGPVALTFDMPADPVDPEESESADADADGNAGAD